MPKKAPSIAAVTVPEYSTLMPELAPELIPLTISRGVSLQNSSTPSLTQSAGLPATAQPQGRPSRVSSWTIIGCRYVIERATPLCSEAGATICTSPKRHSSG